MIQRGKNGEQRRELIKPQYIKYHFAAQRGRRYPIPRQPVILVPIFIVVYSLFSGQQLFWHSAFR